MKELNDITAAALIDAQHTFLNGAGGEKGAENQTASTVKKYYDGKKKMPYVSAQAGRRMLRDTMIEETGWPSSEIKVLKLSSKGSTSKSGGEFNPVDYPEDDICGYMRTEPKQVKDKTKAGEEGVEDEDAVVVEEKPKEMIHVKGLQRTSPLNMPMFRSLYATVNTDHAWNHPKIGTPNPYDTEFYSATLECVMGLDYKRLGVFNNMGDKKELEEIKIPELLKAGRIRLVNNGSSDKLGEIYELTNVEESRKERSAAVLNALVHLRGGAKKAAYGCDIAPKALILSGMTCANMIYNDVFEDDGKGPTINLNRLEEVLNDWSDRISTTLYIGMRLGYIQNEEEVKTWAKNKAVGINIVVGTPISVVKAFNETYLSNGHAFTEEEDRIETNEGITRQA